MLETASSAVNNGSLEYTIERIGPERIIFGTDMPLLEVSVQMARVSGAAISQHDKDLIFRRQYGANVGAQCIAARGDGKHNDSLGTCPGSSVLGDIGPSRSVPRLM